MRAVLLAAASVVMLGAAAPPASAQQSPSATEVGLPQLALTNLPAKGGATLGVTTPAFQPGGDIPFENTQYRGNRFPGLAWTGAPAGTRSFAIIMQDTDGLRAGVPILHWTMFNLPATATGLEAGFTTPPAGASYGPNVRGASQPYLGPRTPAGPKHRYHLQVFALDSRLALDSAATYDALAAAMKDHVLASGQVVGLGQIDPTAPPRPAAPAASVRPTTH